MKQNSFWKGAGFGFLAAALLALAGWQGLTGGTALEDFSVIKKLSYLEEVIDARYLEERDEKMMAEGLYKGLLTGLEDPYSGYYTAWEYEEQNSETAGAYVGIGVVMQKNQEGGVLVVECYEGSPAEAAGIKKDDIISAIDGIDITETEITDVVSMIRENEKGSAVLTVHRQGEEEPLKLMVEISDVELPSVFPEMLDSQTGYIRISEFTGVTVQQYQSAFEDLKKQGMKRLVIDLRGNPGGLLDSVCGVLEEILPQGLIVYTEDKYGHREEFNCEGTNPLDMPLAVLVNEGSASASEIFAGAVQDYGIGTIVGTTTFGKGVVQAVVPLSDGSAVRLTVSRYYTPKGNSIHEKGIKPDVEVKLDSALLNQEEICHEEDNQLQEALKVLGR